MTDTNEIGEQNMLEWKTEGQTGVQENNGTNDVVQ